MEHYDSTEHRTGYERFADEEWQYVVQMEAGKRAECILIEADPPVSEEDRPYFEEIIEAGKHARDELAVKKLPYIRAVAYSFPSKAHYDNEDLVQIGTVAYIEALGRFDPSQGVSTLGYATKRIRGAMIDFLRRKEVQLSDFGLYEQIQAIPPASPFDVSLLEQLPDRQKEVAVLYIFGNLTQAEISRKLGIAPSAVSRSLHGAIQKMRVEYNKISTLDA